FVKVPLNALPPAALICQSEAALAAATKTKDPNKTTATTNRRHERPDKLIHELPTTGPFQSAAPRTVRRSDTQINLGRAGFPFSTNGHPCLGRARPRD